MAFVSVAQELPDTEQDLTRIIYKSKLKVEEGKTGEQIISEIIKQSVRKNPDYQISGMLYLDQFNLCILQVLEGPTANARQLFQLIEKDPRHCECVVISEEKITTRRFGEWGMLQGTEADWNEMQTLLPSAKEWRGLPSAFDLSTIDKLPIAGDLDLKLVRITYKSIMGGNSTEERNSMMEKILEKSQRKNRQLLIGGILYYNTVSHAILQVIEGPSNAVEGLYNRISVDPRHTSVQLLKSESINERTFKAFGMLWAKNAQSNAIFENLPPHLTNEIKTFFTTSSQQTTETASS